MPIVQIRVAGADAWPLIRRSADLADAMRPCVVAAESRATGDPAFERQTHAVVTHRAAVFIFGNSSQVLAVLRPFQREFPSLIDVRGGRARVVGDSIQCARSTDEV